MTTCIVHQCAVEAGKIQGKTMLLWVISLAIAKGVTKFLPYTTLCLVIRASTGCFTTCGHYCRRFFFLGLCDQKSSYKHVSDFGRLRSYGHFLIPCTSLRVNRVSRNQLAGDVLNSVAYLLRFQHYFRDLTRAVHNRAAASVAAGGGIFENQL